jgi:hypothetical protein
MPIAPDFPAAVIAALQGNTACARAFGDSPATPKFHGVQAFKAAPPYARILELPASDTFQSTGSDGLTSSFERGELQLDVFATSESSARSLGKLAAAPLNDAPLVFADGTLLELRQSRAFFTPEPDAGPGVAIVYHRVILFLYVIQRSF